MQAICYKKGRFACGEDSLYTNDYRYYIQVLNSADRERQGKGKGKRSDYLVQSNLAIVNLAVLKTLLY